ncbi:hypothetical protein THAOC_20459, partial [Thalassiosira oceanica]
MYDVCKSIKSSKRLKVEALEWKPSIAPSAVKSEMGRHTPESLVRRLTNNASEMEKPVHRVDHCSTTNDGNLQHSRRQDSRSMEALKQLFCGGMAGSAAKTVTAP